MFEYRKNRGSPLKQKRWESQRKGEKRKRTIEINQENCFMKPLSHQ